MCAHAHVQDCMCGSVCMGGCVTCLYMHVHVPVRTGGFTKLLKLLLQAQRGAGPHPKSHSTGANTLWPVSVWLPFSSPSLYLQLHDADVLSVHKETLRQQKGRV